MKKILLVLLSGILTFAATAQSITITFNGTTANSSNNNNNNNYNRPRNFQVVLDGTSYYSNGSTDPNISTTEKKDILLTNQQLGSHTIDVYRVRNNYNNTSYPNQTTNNNGSNGNAVYSNTFQLRQGYDMIIAIAANGQVTFTEKRTRNRGNRYNQQNIPPMADATYNQLLQTVRSKWLQPQKITLERDAFQNTSNYFSTEQVRQLLVLITSEPNRLVLAKAAYPRVVDAANYTQIGTLFNNSANRNDLNNFIRNNPNNNGYDNGNWNNNNNNNNNNNQYRTAMADYQFNQVLQNINGQNQYGKINTIRNTLNNNTYYFSTSQIRQMLSLLTSENDRLEMAKLSYARVSDPANFTSLYDLFYNQSSRNDLNNYVIQHGGNGTNVQYNSRIPMADATYSALLQKAGNHFLPWDKVRDVRDAFNNTSNYFTTYQIRQLLSLVGAQADRLDLAKLSWSRVTDPGSFTQLFDLFTSQASRDDLNSYISAHPF